MRSQVRDRVSRNMDYHQKLAEHYQDITSDDGEPDETTKYLAELHAEVAKQLRDVLIGGGPAAITGVSSPVTRDTSVIPTRTRADRVN
jgi:hypothetical protein